MPSCLNNKAVFKLRHSSSPEEALKIRCRAELKLRSPSEWKAILLTIPDQDIRTRVACIVWWDYFASRPYRRRWSHLDQYLRSPFVAVDHDALVAGLIQVGFVPPLAIARVHSVVDES
jgi:hypothetical protein